LDLWSSLEKRFRRGSKKMLVAKTLFKYGLRINKVGEVFLGDIKIPYTAVSRALGVDRRTLKSTIEDILKERFLRDFFMNLEPAGPFLRRVSKILGYRCLAIEVYEDKPGILAMVSTALAKRGVNIVQVIAEDPNLVEEPKLYVIVAGEVPGDALNEIIRNENIKSLTII